MDQLPPETDAVEPGKFTTIAEFRVLHENIIQYLSIVKSTAGFPFLYLIRDAALPADDPGYGLPSFDEELATRGRLGGVFYAASNKKLWGVMRTVCHGTAAWTHVQPFARRFDEGGLTLPW